MTTGMSAPPIGMISRKPSAKLMKTISQKSIGALLAKNPIDEEQQRQAKRDIDDMPERQHDRRARHPAIELQEGDDRTGEGDRADGRAQRHFDAALRMDLAAAGNAEGIRRIEGRRRHEHRGKADQRMERRHKLRHGRHGDAPGGERANAAANGDAADDQHPRPADWSARRGPAW